MRPPGETGRLEPMRYGPVRRLWAWSGRVVDRGPGWAAVRPPLLGALVLGGLRITLRRRNLQDTDGLPTLPDPAPGPEPEPEEPCLLPVRSADGTGNDPRFPAMGSAGRRFGRNVPLAETLVDHERMLHPNPRVVSRELMTRHELIPASTLNLLAATWLQFMVHDWLQHGQNERSDPWVVPLADDDPWPHHPMHVARTRHDPTRPPHQGAPPTFVNTVTHWWDGSQIYGSDAATQRSVRSGERGKLAIGADELLPLDARTHQDATGVTANYWVGLSVMHTLFTLEHNAICDHLRAGHPSWSDDDLFHHARLVNTALMAKIHTVEWTPGILGHPTLRVAMNANWWGLFGQRFHRRFGHVFGSELLSGIPGSAQDQFGVPYSITEDFVAVYRMHPLVPDEYRLRSHRDDASVLDCELGDLTFRRARGVVERVRMTDLLYSFGTMSPGAICLHNFPRGLQRLERPNGTIVDLAATDILRNRERGVPRYNRFRQLLHLRPVETFEELTSNRDWADELRRVYDGDIDSVDLMAGLYAETPPAGFGFSDTAFRIFILMASRRLNSDRFFTTDYRSEIYSEAGLRWVDGNGFAEVLTRHFPKLAPALTGVANPFAPWHRAGG